MIKLFKYIKPYWFLCIVTVLLVFFQALSNIILPSLLSRIVNEGVLTTIIDPATGLSQVIVNPNGVGTILEIGVTMLGFAVIVIVAAVLATKLTSYISYKFGGNIRQAIFYKVTNFSLSDINKFGTASLITRTTNDVTQIQNLVFMLFRILLLAPLTFVGGLIMALQMSTSLSQLLVITLPILALLFVVVGLYVVPKFKIVQKNVDSLNRVSREGITGVRVIRAFSREKTEKSRFDKVNVDITTLSIKLNKVMAVLFPAMFLILNLTTLSIVYFGADLSMSGTIEVGNIMAMIQYVTMISMSFMMLAISFVMIPRAAASASRINEILETEIKIQNSPTPATTFFEEGTIEFNDVFYRFSGANEYTLKNINFKINKGETVAIVGTTGGGKSTLINLIPRFYEATQGEVKVDGVNVKDIDIKLLRNKVSFITQKPTLFTGTIAENIMYGCDKNESRLQYALDISKCSDFVSAKEGGVEHMVTQNGSNFSGGQKQRISIARAIYKDSEIYVFDDSFSALDFKTDAALRKEIKEKLSDKTIIIVAQRISTIMDADKIVLLKDGNIEAIGSHEQLETTSELYREILLSQAQAKEVA